jgi:hypothetical protein
MKDLLAFAIAAFIVLTALVCISIFAPIGVKVGIIEITDIVETKNKLYRVTARLSRPVHNDSGQITYNDGTISYFDAYIPETGPMDKEAYKIRLYLDFVGAPYGAHDLETFKKCLPTQVLLRHR